jgi:hypothetical protein
MFLIAASGNLSAYGGQRQSKTVIASIAKQSRNRLAPGFMPVGYFTGRESQATNCRPRNAPHLFLMLPLFITSFLPSS